MTQPTRSSLFTTELLRPALVGSLTKLDPRVQARNPGMALIPAA